MTSLEKAIKIAEILDSKLGMDIKVLKVKDLTILADYFVIAGGSSATQVKALSEEVEYKLDKDYGEKPYSVEGDVSRSWTVLDYSDVIVHVFGKEAREFYSLERLWSDAQEIELNI